MVGVSKFYDKKPVLKDIYLSYFYGAKIGVIGLNGSGKSSLLRILAGVDKDFNGETVISPGFTVGFLEQEPLIDDARTVREVVEELRRFQTYEYRTKQSHLFNGRRQQVLRQEADP